jgi:hypothetical protein
MLATARLLNKMAMCAENIHCRYKLSCFIQHVVPSAFPTEIELRTLNTDVYQSIKKTDALLNKILFGNYKIRRKSKKELEHI